MPATSPKKHRRDHSWVNTNNNTSWFESPGSWSFYLALIIATWLVLCAFIDPLVALSYTVLVHFVVTFYLFHWHKGSPIAADQGAYDMQTFWEQIDGGVQLTSNKKFLTVVPVALFLLSWQKGDHTTPIGLANLMATIVLVIAKLPIMHKVRLFGINRF